MYFSPCRSTHLLLLCRKNLLGISHITNEEVKARISMKTWQWKDANWSGTGTSHDHLDWPRLDLGYPTGSSSGRETKRQTEETMGRQRQRVGWLWMDSDCRGRTDKKPAICLWKQQSLQCTWANLYLGCDEKQILCKKLFMFICRSTII